MDIDVINLNSHSSTSSGPHLSFSRGIKRSHSLEPAPDTSSSDQLPQDRIVEVGMITDIRPASFVIFA